MKEENFSVLRCSTMPSIERLRKNTFNWELEAKLVQEMQHKHLNNQFSQLSSQVGWLWLTSEWETKKVASYDDVVFKLCLSTLIGNLLLKEFSLFSSLCYDVTAPHWIGLCSCCVEDDSQRFRKRFFASFLFFRQSFFPRSRTHISISPLALSNKTSLRCFCSALVCFLHCECLKSSKAFCCVFLTEHVAFSVFFVASSQLYGAIDFNIIDFLCHYQPLARSVFLLFFGFVHTKMFLYRNGRASGEKQQRKKHKIQKTRET